MAAPELSEAPRAPARGRVLLNAAANYGGSLWTALLSVVLVPVYVRYVGVEAYGIIGLFAVVQALASLLDLGLSPTLSRELAHQSGRAGSAGSMRTLVRTLEVVYWAVAVLLGLALLALAPLLAHRWVEARGLSDAQVLRAFWILGLSFAVQWPASVYTGGLQGLQRQVELNAVLAGMGTVRSLGALAVLAWVSPTLDAFLFWQLASGAAQTLLLGLLLWKSLPRAAGRARFSAPELRRVGRFAVGMSALSVLTLLLTSTDRVVLSKLLTLEAFGYYSLAATMVVALNRLTAPLFSAFFPRLAQLAGEGREDELREVYHHGCALMSVILLPASAVLVLFAPEVLWVWTQDAAIVANARVVMALLVAGTAFNGLMVLPYALQVAFGWTRLLLYFNAAAVLVLVPGVILLGMRWGGPGAAAMWLVLNASYVVIQPVIVHRRLLRGEVGRWYLHDVGRPLLAVLAVAGAARLLLPWDVPRFQALALLALVGAACTLAAGLTFAWMREGAARALSRLGRRLWPAAAR